MKKIIAILLALSALTVSALAAGSSEPKAADAVISASEEAAPELTAVLTEESALAVALKDAGLTEDAVAVSRNKLTEKDGADGQSIVLYSVKFSTDTTSYKYYVDGNTGAILYKSVEFRSPVLASADRGGETETAQETGETSSRSRGTKSSGEMNEDGNTAAQVEDDTAASGETSGSVEGKTSSRSGRTGGRSASGETEKTQTPSEAVGA